MPWGEGDIPSLDGKVALITGANSGIGLAAAAILAKHGARVVMACRNAAKAEAAAQEVRSTATGPVEVIPLDLSSLASIDDCASAFVRNEPKLDYLLNNAGLMAIDHATTADGFEMQLGVNHLGHFALTAKLWPLLVATPGARVVNQSSFGHRLGGRIRVDDLFFEQRGYNRWTPYFHSKLANILFTNELHRRGGTKVAALAAHPGGTHTDLGSEGRGWTNVATRLGMPLMQSTRMGALPMVRAAVAPSARSGEFYGPNLLFRGAPRRETPSRHARNESDARALWERSEALTGIEFEPS
jgi:NAD(P)-dependent dehydrogenase (short-subunit alcohol dehydrogenase family)